MYRDNFQEVQWNCGSQQSLGGTPGTVEFRLCSPQGTSTVHIVVLVLQSEPIPADWNSYTGALGTRIGIPTLVPRVVHY